MTFHVERIDHVVLRCRDLPGMVRFYEQALGFNVERKLDRISRSLFDFTSLMRELQARRVEFVSTRSRVFGDT